MLNYSVDLNLDLDLDIDSRSKYRYRAKATFFPMYVAIEKEKKIYWASKQYCSTYKFRRNFSKNTCVELESWWWEI